MENAFELLERYLSKIAMSPVPAKMAAPAYIDRRKAENGRVFNSPQRNSWHASYQ